MSTAEISAEPPQLRPELRVVTPKEPSETALFNGTERVILTDELPNVLDLASDFEYLLASYSHPANRVRVALEYAEHLKGRYKPGEFSVGEYEYAHHQILPRLYLDSFVLRARRDDYQATTKHRHHNGGNFALAQLEDLIQAKVDLQQDITDYVELNPDKSSDVLFANLAQITHHSRRLLFGDDVTYEKARQQNLSQLLAILAEYKVLTALHEEWPAATFGTIDQDRDGTDIVVPTDADPQKVVALQIKHSKSPNGDLRIHEEAKPPLINVPMNLINNDPLKLSGEHRLLLKQFVQIAPRQRLRVAI